MDSKEVPSLYSGFIHVWFLLGQDLFELGQHVVEDVEEDVDVVLLEHQRGTETDRSIPTASQEDTCQQNTVRIRPHIWIQVPVVMSSYNTKLGSQY